MESGNEKERIQRAAEPLSKGQQLRYDVFYYTCSLVNITCVGAPGAEDWILVDTGLPGYEDEIIQAAAARFGAGRKPSAIILTHGHFDHSGGAAVLLASWDVPVYAHFLEAPFLTGMVPYPSPASHGRQELPLKIIAAHSSYIDLKKFLQPLPEDGSIPGVAGWRWIHTPGHTPGHISLYREADRTIIAGDAFITVPQDSVYRVPSQKTEVNGPPWHLTSDWEAAKESVRRLDALRPELVIPGHGKPMEGEELRHGLGRLAREFNVMAKPF